jgi:hypothetical protein
MLSFCLSYIMYQLMLIHSNATTRYQALSVPIEGSVICLRALQGISPGGTTVFSQSLNWDTGT